MFDIITKNVDMKNILAIPIDMQELLTFYNNTHPEFEVFYDEKEPQLNQRMKKKKKTGITSQFFPVEVYEIVEHFIQEKTKIDPFSNFIVDELPIAIDGKYYFSSS